MVKFNVKTPLDFLKDLRTNVIVEIEGNRYKNTATIRGNELIINLFGNIKASTILKKCISEYLLYAYTKIEIKNYLLYFFFLI